MADTSVNVGVKKPSPTTVPWGRCSAVFMKPAPVKQAVVDLGRPVTYIPVMAHRASTGIF